MIKDSDEFIIQVTCVITGSIKRYVVSIGELNLILNNLLFLNNIVNIVITRPSKIKLEMELRNGTAKHYEW